MRSDVLLKAKTHFKFNATKLFPNYNTESNNTCGRSVGDREAEQSMAQMSVILLLDISANLVSHRILRNRYDRQRDRHQIYVL